jgi:hypothetical protein
MNNSATLEAVSNFDRLPDDGIVSAKVAKMLLGDVLTERALRRNPPIPRRQISQRRFGFRVGDIRALVRGEALPAA